MPWEALLCHSSYVIGRHTRCILILAEGSVNGEKFEHFVKECLLPVLMPYDGVNPRSIVVMGNASIHHVQQVTDLIENQAKEKLIFLPPYSPDLNPAEEVFSNNYYETE